MDRRLYFPSPELRGWTSCREFGAADVTRRSIWPVLDGLVAADSVLGSGWDLLSAVPQGIRALTTSCSFPLFLQQASRLLSASSSTTKPQPHSPVRLSARVKAGDFGPSAPTLEIAIPSAAR